MKKTTALTIAFCVALTVSAKNITVEPKGEYATIDTTLANETIKVLSQGSESQKKKVIAEIKARPEKYAPPVFYALSHTLFEVDKEDALFWFYAGQIRIRYDANRCADKSARSAADVLSNQYGPLINQYAFQNIDLLKKIIPKVVKWDEQTPNEYDLRWINLHGMGAFTGGDKELSLPQSEWATIKKQTRDEYWEGFQEAMKSME